MEQVCNHVMQCSFYLHIVTLSVCNVYSNSFLGTGAGINLSSLLIKEGKVCWDLYIDGLVISSDGNLLDALGAAIKVILVIYVWFSLLTFSVKFGCEW